MRIIFSLSLLFIGGLASAQDETDEWKEASKESHAYHEYRMKITTPPYGLAKVQALIKKAKYNEETEMEKVDATAYAKLSLREKFTYHMIHPESFSQICDAFPPIQDEQKKIFASLPDAFGEYNWSDDQLIFFSKNRDTVKTLIMESVRRSKRMGLNYKRVVAEINGWEMIPFLIEVYHYDNKDHDILTLLMLLMKENNYKPFLESLSYQKLYSEEADYFAYINYNQPNEDLIIKRATDFYNDLTK